MVVVAAVAGPTPAAGAVAIKYGFPSDDGVSSRGRRFSGRRPFLSVGRAGFPVRDGRARRVVSGPGGGGLGGPVWGPAGGVRGL